MNQYAIHVSAAILRPGDELLVVRELDRRPRAYQSSGRRPATNRCCRRSCAKFSKRPDFQTIPSEIAFVAEGVNERWPDPGLEICFYAQIERQSEPPDRTGEQILSVEWMSLDDPQLFRAIPQVVDFRSSKRGRYIDQAICSNRRTWEHRDLP